MHGLECKWAWRDEGRGARGGSRKTKAGRRKTKDERRKTKRTSPRKRRREARERLEIAYGGSFSAVVDAMRYRGRMSIQNETLFCFAFTATFHSGLFTQLSLMSNVRVPVI